VLAVLQKPQDVISNPDSLNGMILQSPPSPELKAHLQSHPPALAPLERRVRQKLSRGSLAPEASIDLHGMDQQTAHSELHHFLRNAQKKGLKLVLVVTGKGGRIGNRPDAVGVLKRAVPVWLSEPFYRSIVVGFEEAARQHGGAGALYVRIRRLDRGLKTLTK
jgi:DNA-nicking Smr family endonuclease